MFAALPKFTLVSALLAASPAFAQDLSTPDDPSANDIIIADRRVDEALTVLAARQPRAATPASVSILTAADLDAAQDVSVADALARLPGVTLSRNGPIGGFTGVRIRGADAAQTLVVIDGVRVQDPSSPGGGFDFGSLLSSGIDRIELLRGSNSLVWGSDAIGGVVLIDTIGEGASGGAGLAGEVGSFDTGRLTARASGSFGSVRFGASGGLITSDGISSAAVGSERDGFRQAAGNARLSIDLGSGFSVRGAVLFAASRLELDGFPAPAFVFADTLDFQKSQEVYTSVALDHDNGSTFHQSLSVAVADVNRDTYQPEFGSSASFAARGRSERVTWQGDWSPGQIGPVDLRLVFGADYEKTRSQTGNDFSSDRRSTAIGGGYGQIVGKIGDRLQLGGGYRHDDHRDFGGNDVWSANAVWQLPIDGLAARASFAEGFKAPTLFQLSDSAGGFGNPDLRPERSRSYDVGLRYGGQRLSAEVSVFRRDSRDLIDFVGCGQSSAPAICASGNRPFGTYANVARARAEGVEVAVETRPVDRLGFVGSYSYIATKDRATASVAFGNDLARRPRHSGTVSTTYDFNDASLPGGGSVTAELRYVGNSFDDAGNVVPLESYALVALRGRVLLTDHIELYGRVENLFDVDYVSVADYGTYGRTATLGVRARF